ncbi:hypothetical protein D3C81_1298640 [compost metagenome]
MLAAGDRERARLLQLDIAFDVVGDHRLFQPAGVELGQARQHAARVFQRPAHVALQHDVDAVTDQLAQQPHLLDVLLHAGGAVLGAVTEAHLHRGKALVEVALRFGQEGVAVVVVVELGGIAPDLFLGAPAQQLEHRLAGGLAHQVPQRDIDRRDRRHADALAAPGVGAAVHLLPQVFVVEGILADHHRRQVLVDDLPGHARRQRAVADADQAGIGLDLDHHPAMEAERTHGIAALEQDVGGVGAEMRLRRHGLALPFEDAGADVGDLHCSAPDGNALARTLPGRAGGGHAGSGVD